MFLLERERARARSRVEDAETHYRNARERHERAVAESDKAYDLWEKTKPSSSDWDRRKQDAQRKGDQSIKACSAHIGSLTVLQQAQRALEALQDPGELERRTIAAEAHEEWWRSRR